MLIIPLRPIPLSLFVLSLSEPFFEVLLYWHSCAGTWRREIMFEMNHRSSWLYYPRARRTLPTSSQPAPFLSHTLSKTPFSSGISSLSSRSPGYSLPSLFVAAPMPLVLNIASVLHPWSVTYFYLYGVRLLTLHRGLVSWGRFLLQEHVQRGELLLITIWDDPSKDYYEGLIVVITATILLPEREAREHDRTAVSLWFSGHSSLHRISIMGVLSRYYHLFNQIFTGRHDIGITNLERGVVSWTASLDHWLAITAKSICIFFSISFPLFYVLFIAWEKYVT